MHSVASGHLISQISFIAGNYACRFSTRNRELLYLTFSLSPKMTQIGTKSLNNDIKNLKLQLRKLKGHVTNRDTVPLEKRGPHGFTLTFFYLANLASLAIESIAEPPFLRSLMRNDIEW